MYTSVDYLITVKLNNLTTGLQPVFNKGKRVSISITTIIDIVIHIDLLIYLIIRVQTRINRVKITTTIEERLLLRCLSFKTSDGKYKSKIQCVRENRRGKVKSQCKEKSNVCHRTL